MKIIVETELRNISPRFKKAIWRSYNVGHSFASAKEAKKFHDLRNCSYCYEDEDGNVIRSFNNAQIDSYGRRYS